VTGSRSIAHRLVSALVWAFVIAGAALALLVAGPLALGDHPHTDLSGSMEPVISPGDVIIDKQIRPSQAQVGDIVTFRDPQNQHKLLTHRVVKITRHDSHMWFVTKGDANNTYEHWEVPAGGQIGKVWYTVPWVGHIFVLAHSRTGWILLVGIPLLLIAGEELMRIWRPRARPDDGGSVGGVG
jgi:signal peptidase I